MSSNWAKTGWGYAPAYQVSGIPFVTSSANNEVKGHDTATEPVHIKFPFVTKWFAIRCTDNTRPLRVGFTRNGVYGPTSGSYMVLPKDGTAQDNPIRFDLAVTDLYFASDSQTLATDFCLIAGLTNIPRGNYLTLTGSAGFEGTG
jgi:hypothetical protein